LGRKRKEEKKEEEEKRKKKRKNGTAPEALESSESTFGSLLRAISLRSNYRMEIFWEVNLWKKKRTIPITTSGFTFNGDGEQLERVKLNPLLSP